MAPCQNRPDWTLPTAEFVPVDRISMFVSVPFSTPTGSPTRAWQPLFLGTAPWIEGLSHDDKKILRSERDEYDYFGEYFSSSNIMESIIAKPDDEPKTKVKLVYSQAKRIQAEVRQLTQGESAFYIELTYHIG